MNDAMMLAARLAGAPVTDTEMHMSSHCRSLRVLVDDWFGSGRHYTVTRPDRSRSMPWRAVRVEVARTSGPLAIVFFRHGDGSWCIYPPASTQPAMNASTQQLELS